MKTLTEALKCLDKDSADRSDMTRADVFLDGDEVCVESVGPGSDAPEMVSIVELGKEIAMSSDVQSLGNLIICCLLGADKPGSRITTTRETANILSSVWSTAFTYGVRVGIEMEKSEETIAL